MTPAEQEALDVLGPRVLELRPRPPDRGQTRRRRPLDKAGAPTSFKALTTNSHNGTAQIGGA